ncbi:hypothetical protein IAT38_004058 [Cryptococcus sp. DSM 104549]
MAPPTPPKSRSASGSSNDDEAPKSIASLRSKFENLAAGGSGPPIGSGSGHIRAPSTGAAGRGGLLSVVSSTPASDDGHAAGDQPIKATPHEPSSRSSSPTPPSTLPQAAPTVRPVSPRPHVPVPPRPSTPKPSFHAQAGSGPSHPPSHLSEGSTLLKPQGPDVVVASPSPASTPLPPTAPTSPAPTHVRRAAPAVPSKPSSAVASAAVTPTASEDGEEEVAAVTSVKALRERFAAQAAAESNGVSGVAAKPPVDVPRAVTVPVAAKVVPAPAIKRTSTDGKTQEPVPLSPSPEGSHSLPPAHHGADLAPTKPAPPPPPMSRSSSPAPPPPNRAHKPPPRTTSPSPTIPPSRGDSASGSTPDPTPPTLPARASSLTPDLQNVPSLPPQLPQRRGTIMSPDSMEPAQSVISPPPIPGRPVPSHSSDNVMGAPPLPSRSRANTISKAELETAPPSGNPAPPPPRLPVRHATISAPTASPAPPPAHPSSPSRSRDGSGTLPPPPLRSAILQSASSSPPRRMGSISLHSSRPTDDDDEQYSEDEDDEPPDEVAPLTGLSAQAKRMLDDFPDSTQANRRPPSFVPDVRIKDCHHMMAFAVFGRHVCTGAHHVRVYDTQLSDHPISVVELRDTGLEHKGKDPKVTAMCFRPGATAAEEGRYLWCGTKDGHLWELDISTGTVSATKPFAHTSSISYIWRHRQNLISLDESGKLLVFEVGDVEGKPPTLLRSLRIGEKFTFAKMLCGRLWTSSGPAVRSTTSAATSKGPTIRVYDPCAAGVMPPAKSLFCTEWTGAVTSATYMPLRRGTIYLGHEGGFVSVWDVEGLVCTQVLKISTTDILALEGVGESLWAGNRKGQVHVYDITEKPWQTTNIWAGHPDNPIQALLVDPYSIEHAGRYTCWSFARDCLRAWDGLLSIDWIDKQLAIRQPEFCNFRDANVLICSWNIDSARPNDLSGSEANAKFLDECLHSVDSPDIIVFGFQEVIPLTNKKMTAKTILFGGKNKDGGSAGDKVSHAYRLWLEKLQQSVKIAMPADRPYVKIHSESLVGLFTCIFVKASEKETLRDLNITTVKRGIGGIYGNKGAIVSRFVLDDTSICFINVHLAAGQSQKAARNADLAGIMEDKAIFPPSEELPFIHGGLGTGILDHEMVFLNGDLNYRIDQRRENVISSIANNELPFLLEHDQLRKEMRSNHAFRLRNFEEAQITFPPTYKYNPGTHDYDSSEKRRIPAWCDRILYRKSPRIKPLSYRRYEPTVSDHKPISAGYTITLKAVDSLKMMDVRREVAGEWAKREKELLIKMGEVFDSIV